VAPDTTDVAQLSRGIGGLVGSLKNGLSVFDMFRPDHPIITVGEIARFLGVHKSSASRIAATLVASGFLRPALRSAGFQLGGKMFRLGSMAAVDNSLADVAHPIMRALVDDVGETCHVGVLEGREAVTVALIDGSYSVRMHSWVGKRTPAHWTAMGKVLLAGLADSTFDMLFASEKLPVATPHSLATKSELKAQLLMIRKHGFALDNEELEIGLRCVATPIFDRDGRVSASLTIAGSSSRMRISAIEAYIEKAKLAAQKISAELGAPVDTPVAND
jgi:DNA-binding IclR family transcriptional regulator